MAIHDSSFIWFNHHNQHYQRHLSSNNDKIISSGVYVFEKNVKKKLINQKKKTK